MSRGLLSFSLLLLFVPVFAESSHPRNDAQLLRAELVRMRGELHAGNMSKQEALESLVDFLERRELNLEALGEFARKELGPVQFEKFQLRVNEALSGIDPTSLTHLEIGELYSEAFFSERSGLSWNGCRVIGYVGLAAMSTTIGSWILHVYARDTWSSDLSSVSYISGGIMVGAIIAVLSLERAGHCE